MTEPAVQEFKLIDLIQVSDKHESIEEAKHFVSGYREYLTTSKLHMEGQLDLLQSSYGCVVRYTSTRDWIGYLWYMVETIKNKPMGNKSVCLIVDCGYQLRKLFKNDQHVKLLTMEEFENMNLKKDMEELDKHVELCIVSCAGVVDKYVSRIVKVVNNWNNENSSIPLYGNVIVGVLDVL